MKKEIGILKGKFSEELFKLNEVVKLTESMLDAVLDTGSDVSLVPFLNKRDGLLKEIASCEEAISSELRKHGKELSFLESEYSEELQGIRFLIVKIQNLDKDIAGKITKQKKDILRELQQIKIGMILPQQYKQHESGGSSFINIKE